MSPENPFRERLHREQGSPIALPLPAVKIAFGVLAAVLVAIGFFFLMQRGEGNFVMGAPGAAAQYFVAVAALFIVGYAGSVLGRGAVSLASWPKRIAAMLALAAAAVLLLWIFVAAPILDIPYLARPSTVTLSEVETVVDDGYEYSVFYKMQGVDAAGELHIFSIDRTAYEGWDPAVRRASVTYLPHSKTVLAIESL